MEQVRFYFMQYPDRVFHGFRAGGTWNGFDNVAVTPAVSRDIETYFLEMCGPGEYSSDDIPPGADGLVDLSGGYSTVIAPELPPVGARVRLTQAIDRFPHFIAPAGSIGTVVTSELHTFAVQMDSRIDGAEEWDNEVCWNLAESGQDNPESEIAVI